MSDEELIKKRLFSVVSTSSLHMMKLLQLMSIRFVSEETKTAAVTCESRPELLLNKEFINSFCKTDEHLFMLVMHELYHVILGHTHLFKRHTEIDNIAFDAVINAILCRLFPGEEYTSFFTQINEDTSFPGCILRPIGENTPEEFIPFLKNLYFTNTGTYFEVYECIAKELNKELLSGRFVLIGNHMEGNSDENNPILKKILDGIISKWPREIVVNGRDLGGEIENQTIKFAKAERKAQIKMNKLLLKAGVIHGSVCDKKMSICSIEEDANGFMPDYKDRTLLSKSLLCNKPLLYNTKISNRRLTKDSLVQTIVYLDVSGSVVDDINHFAPLLLKPYKNKECILFAFSTIVEKVTYQDFRKGKYKSTGGTSADCIFEHYFSLQKKQQTKKILILTDGYTGQVSSEYVQRIKNKKLEVYCGLFGTHTKEDLKPIIKYFEEFK